MSDVQPYGLQPATLLCSWDSPGKNTGVGCHALLQGIFQAQGLKLYLSFLLHWQTGSLLLVTPGKPTLHLCLYMNRNLKFNMCETELLRLSSQIILFHWSKR